MSSFNRYNEQRVVAVFAHPDDETYAAGGLLARLACGGATVYVFSLTTGEAGQARHPDPTPGRSFGARRAAELGAACHALGTEPPIVFDAPDGGICDVSDDWVDAFAHSVRARSPQLMVTLGKDGAYGHRDHTACTTLLTRVRRQLHSNIRVLHAQFPQGLFRPLHRALHKHAPSLLDPKVRACDLGIPSDTVALRMELSSDEQARKLAAISAYCSQLYRGDPRTFLMPSLIDPLLKQEWFTVAFGPPLPAHATDPFA